MRQRRRRDDRLPQYEDPVYTQLLQRLSANLRRLRAERRWTQADAADRCAMAVSQYQFVERGETNLTFTTAAKLAKGFSVDVIDLLLVVPVEAQAGGTGVDGVTSAVDAQEHAPDEKK